MKPKVISVESINSNYIFDPELIKYEFRRKINTRLSGLHHQMKLNGYRDSVPAKEGSAKRSSSPPDEIGTAAIFKKEKIPPDELVYYIHVAMKLQQNLYEAAMATNRGYDLQLLLIFLESFLSFIFNCYYLIAVIAIPHVFKLPREEAIAYLLQHLILPTMYVVVPVMGFAHLKAAFRQSQKIVNKIIIYVQDSEVRTLLLAFSQQIAVNTPEFGIFGFFSLDGSVIFAMISSTTTYLIILVQTLGDSDNRSLPSVANKTV